VSLENGTDSGVVQEGLAWNLHRMASGSYGYQAAFASWVQLRINGQLIGVYVNAEQRDKQMLRNRGLWTADETWIFDQDDIGVPEIEDGDGFSPTNGTPADEFNSLRAWVAARDVNVRSQLAANGPPSPRP
jgi:hypothetical protein